MVVGSTVATVNNLMAGSGDHADLLVELGCEELPPRTLQRLAQSFHDGVCKGLADAGVEIDSSSGSIFYTPRRMGFRLVAVPQKQADQVLERRGPAIGAAFDAEGQPTPAAIGFARSVAREVEDLERQKTDKGEWLFCRVEKPGNSLGEILFPILEKSLTALPVAKPMRWSDHDFSFVRPVHWLLVMHGDDVLDGSLYGKQADRLTYGHRVHSPGPHAVSSTREYESVLYEACVIVDPAERKQKIRHMAEEAGRTLDGTTRIMDSLLDEVTNIVEWPLAVCCRFEDAFLDVPQEALIASMEDHQKFFPVLNAQDGSLTSGFVVIANLDSTHQPSVQEGFERVIRPRLADAQFFWEQDKKSALSSYSEALNAVVFQKDLGSIGDKSKRIDYISCALDEILNSEGLPARRAALLCKCDLITQMVAEFPELQGTMGAHYARVSGEDPEVSEAIGEHYFPRFAGDQIPASALGRILSLSDRLDTLLGIFAAGLKPTGNKDPFALRRAALGSVRILTEARLPVSLDVLLAIVANALKDTISVSSECVSDARVFILERLRHYFLDQAYDTNVVNAVFAAPVSTLADLHDRLDALAGFMKQPEAANLVAANKRIGNILRKSSIEDLPKIESKLLLIEEEERLFEDVNTLEASMEPLIQAGDYPSALKDLVKLDACITAFFEQVMVMDEDPQVRDNRLALLAKLKGLFDGIADLSLAT